MSRFVICVLVFSSLSAMASDPDDSRRAVFTTEIGAGVAAVWEAFTTEEGIESWMAPVAEIELEVGGALRTNYNPEGEIGDVTTIENTILSFDPMRMLSLQATGYPEGFPYAEAAAGTWSVFYFEPVGENRTRITVVGLGYTDDPKSQELRSFFAAANSQLLDDLERVLQEAEPEVSR
jgi:uncharacterized protein YndB with AHSA1/START domain